MRYQITTVKDGHTVVVFESDVLQEVNDFLKAAETTIKGTEATMRIKFNTLGKRRKVHEKK